MRDFRRFTSFIDEACDDYDINDEDELLDESNFTPTDWNENYGCTADSYKKRIIDILLKNSDSINDNHSLIMNEKGTYKDGLNLIDYALQQALLHNQKYNGERRIYTPGMEAVAKADGKKIGDYIDVYKFGKSIDLDSFTKYAKPENKNDNKDKVKSTLEKLEKMADDDEPSNDDGTILTNLFFIGNDIPWCVRKKYSSLNLWTVISKNGNIKTGSAGKIFEIRANIALENYISQNGVTFDGDIKFVPIYNNMTGKINLITKSRVVKHKNDDGSLTRDPSDPKADLVLSTDLSALKDITVLDGDVDISTGDKIFISYKKLSVKPVRDGAGDFSGYGGISAKSGENIAKNKQVIDFACNCLMLFDPNPHNMLNNDITPYKHKYAQILTQQGIDAKFLMSGIDKIKADVWKNVKYGICPPTTSLYKQISVDTEDAKNLIRYAMYGKDYVKGGAPGFDNCNCIIQGKVLLNKTDMTCKIKVGNRVETLPVFELGGSHIQLNGEIPPVNDKNWKICLWAVRKEEDRNNLKIVGLRVNIAPFGWRSNATPIDDAIKTSKEKYMEKIKNLINVWEMPSIKALLGKNKSKKR